MVAIGTIISTKAGLVNIGQEGQLVVGAAFATFASTRVPGPGPFVLLLILLAGVVGGSLWSGIAGGLATGQPIVARLAVKPTPTIAKDQKTIDKVSLENKVLSAVTRRDPTIVPRVVGPIKRNRPVQVRDVEFLRANTTRRIKVTVPGPFTMSQQVQNDHYPDRASLAMDYAVAVNQEVKALFEAGADVVQLDEPWLQAHADDAREFGVPAINKALEGVIGTTGLHLCFGYAAVVKNKASEYAFLAELDESAVDLVSIEAVQPDLDMSVLAKLPSKTMVVGVIDLEDAAVEPPEAVAAKVREALKYRPPEQLMLAPDCGMKYLPRDVAFGKLQAMVRGVELVRSELR
jgi:5-methyltetrahydropteroyltriglutamate--homocysteine methyltransferase